MVPIVSMFSKKFCIETYECALAGRNVTKRAILTKGGIFLN